MSGAEGPLRIAVAGGSIGGLCAGLALGGAGFDVQVYERVSGPMETRGAGIVVQGELTDLLGPTARTPCRRHIAQCVAISTPKAVTVRSSARPRT